jgi:hypothetical protein
MFYGNNFFFALDLNSSKAGLSFLKGFGIGREFSL